MLSKKFRLPLSDTKFIGKSFKGKYLSMIAKPSPHPHNRFAIIASKKFSSKAVKRNRIKRQLRHILLEYLQTSPYHDILFIVTSKNPVTSTDLTKDLNILFSRLSSQHHV